MYHQLRLLCGIIIFLLRLNLVLGNPKNTYNFSCFLQLNGELVRDLKNEPHNPVFRPDAYNFTVKMDLDNIIEERIKAYMDANNVFGKAKKEGKTKLEKKIPNYSSHFHQSEPRVFRRSFPESEDDLSLKSPDPEKVNDEQNELKRLREELEIKYKELRYLVDGIQEKLLFLERDKQYYEGEIFQLDENMLTEEKARFQLENRVEEIFEMFCTHVFITEKSVRVDTPSSFRENLWIMCNKKIGFRKTFMSVSYKEIEYLNASCPGQDSCAMIRNSDSLLEHNCHCGHLCSTLDTCCFDSSYQGMPPGDGPLQSCQAVEGVIPLAFFMVDECPRNGTATDEWRTLCAQGEEGNLKTLVPVTSTKTNLTYKNYYCFACHETTDNYHFWEVEIRSKEKIATDASGPIIIYDSNSKQWIAHYTYELNNTYFDTASEKRKENLLISVKKPSKIQHLVTECRKGVINKCHDNWLDDITRNQCNAYMSMITLRSTGITYKNPHCALCNFETLNSTLVDCGYRKPPLLVPQYINADYGRRANIDREAKLNGRFNYADFFPVTSVNCPENFIWNPFTRECSPLLCALGYSLKNGICVAS